MSGAAAVVVRVWGEAAACAVPERIGLKVNSRAIKSRMLPRKRKRLQLGIVSPSRDYSRREVALEY